MVLLKRLNQTNQEGAYFFAMIIPQANTPIQNIFEMGRPPPASWQKPQQ